MLNGLLGQYPSYPMLPECSVISLIFELRKRFELMTLNDKARFDAYFGDLDNVDELIRNTVLSLISRIPTPHREPRRFLTLKDPELTKYIRPLSETLRKGRLAYRLIGVARDPRDMVVSLCDVSKRRGDEIDPFEYAVETLSPFLDQMVKLKRKPVFHLLFVKYEDIIKADFDTFEKLHAHIGYKITLEPYRERAFDLSDEIRADPFFVENYTKNELLADNTARWRTKLSPEQVSYIEKKFSKFFLAFGYAPAKGSDNSSVERLAF